MTIIINDNAPANYPQQCHNLCVLLSTCKFWDFGESICRLRSNAGPKGLEEDRGFAYGSKNCRLGKSVYTTECNNL